MRRVRVMALLLFSVGSLLNPAAAPGAQHADAQRFVLLVSGLGGEPFYSEQFQRWAGSMLEVADQRLRIEADNLIYLAEAFDGADDERSAAARARLNGESRKDAVLAALRDVADRSRDGDLVLVLLIGHGTATGSGAARFNLPGPDLSAAELGSALDALAGSRIAVINATPSSAPFVAALSAPGRFVVTATSSLAEVHHTRFTGHFVDALAGTAADANKDGKVSLLEAFRQAQRQLKREYDDAGLLLTEHAQLEDTGDGVASREPGAANAEGELAANFFMGAPDSSADASESVRIRRLELQGEARRMVDSIEALKRDKPSLDTAVFESELEDILIKLALNRRAYRAAGEIAQ